MTEDDLVLETEQDLQPVDASDATESIDDDMQKPVLNKVQVNDIVKREKLRAYERGKKDALMQLEQQQAQMQQEQNPMQQQQAPQAIGGMSGLTADDVRRMIAEQTPQALQEQVMQHKAHMMYQTFASKIAAAEQQYPGLEAEIRNLNLEDDRLHKFIEIANNFDNTGDIMKEVVDNPDKLETLLSMAKNQPYAAQKKLQSLSASIKQNMAAKAQEVQARDPMSQIKPSSTAGMDNGAMNVSDFRKMFK
jgi:hypothetical protein